MRIATMKHTDGDGRETVRPIFIIDDREDLAQLFADADAGKAPEAIAAEYATATEGQSASPHPESLNIVTDIIQMVRQGLKIKDVTEDTLHVRFFDADRLTDDLPVIIYAKKTWIPYAGTRVQSGDTFGYHVEYALQGSTAIAAIGRMGKSNGVVLDLDTNPAAKPKREQRDSWAWSQTSEAYKASLTKPEQDALRFGYVRCPNHPNRWYASGPGKPELPRSLGLEVHIEAPSFQPGEYHSIQDTWPIAVYGRAYGPASVRIKMMRFETWDRFIRFVEGITTISPGGQPGNDVTNVWD